MSTSSVHLATPQSKVRLSTAFRSALILGASLLLPVSQANADPGIRFQWSTVRATVSVNTTNTSFYNSAQTNNSVVLVDGVTNAIFDIAGLPAGVTATLQDTNGVPLTSITGSSNVWLAVNTTNLPEGVYTFTVDATGTDTNGNNVTNFFPFVVQSAFIWNAQGPGTASFNRSNNWAGATNWVGGAVPGTGDDVVISDAGSQTNVFAGGLGFTNIGITANTTISSLRFSQSIFTNATSTNGEFHTLWISPGATLSVTGAVGFSLLRDYVPEFGFSPDGSMGVGIGGTNATLVVSNASANFGVLIPGSINPTLTMSNLGTFAAVVNRFGVSDYQLYPNYLAMNTGYNGGRDSNSYNGIPRRFWSTVYLARTNIIKALYHDPNNYTNEFTRGYALSLQNNELSGNGSSVNTFFLLGVSNIFFADSVLFVGANSASGNGGGTKFWQTSKASSSAFFRGTNGGRMTIMSFSDDGGTNEASSNVKSTTDFWNGNSNRVDILADKFYVARDRTMIASNQTPNVQGDVTIGYGNVDVNTAILGFQEHSNKIDWPSLGSPSPYLNYCQGRLVVTNGGTGFPGVFKVNGNLTLGFTADMNPPGSAEQYNTFGRITISTNATVIASNIICDGGLNYWDSTFGRQNSITINQGGTLVISNTAGFLNLGASDFSAADPRGMPLDSLTISGGATLTLQVDPSKTNVFVRTLTTPGIIPGVIKVAKLTGVSSYPVQIPVISYQGSATPFLNADVSALGAGFFCYVINNTPNQTVDLFVTTNPPNNLLWTGSTGNNTWDTNSLNWVPVGGGAATNFNTGDIVTFDDSSTFNNINIASQVVPGQTGSGVTISNSLRQYTFSGGLIVGTALISKQGTNQLEFDASEQGPLNITAGTVFGSGAIGNTTVSSNAVLNYSGSVNGGLTSTGEVLVASSGVVNGPVSIQGGYLDNVGKINTTINQVVSMGGNSIITNEASGTFNVGSGPGASGSLTWDVPAGSTLVNLGNINLFQPRISVEGLLFGNGTFNDPNGGGLESVANGNAARVLINQGGTMGVGPTPSGSVGSVNMQCRFDFNNDPTANPAGISTILMDFDLSNPQINDVINCDRWNNDTGLLLFTNINPSAGTFTNGLVLTVFNNTSGSGTNNHVDTTGFSPFIQPYVPGSGLVWNVTNFNTFGTISVTTNAQIWDGTSGGNWSTNVPADTSWKTGQLYQDYGGAYFDDTASGTTTVTITTPVAPAGIRGTILDSNQPTFFPGLTVSNAAKDYVFTSQSPGKITGVTGIYKTGSGTLTLLTTNANDFSGNVIIDNGTLAVSNLLGNTSILSLGAAGGGQMKNDIILDGGTLSYIGLTNVNLNHFPVLYPHSGSIAVTSATNMLTLDKIIDGVGSLTKIGPGTLSLAGGSVHTGGTIVQAGTLRLTGATPGTGSLTFNSNTSLEITNNNTLTNTLNMTGSGVALKVLGAGTNVFSGPWSGGGSVTFSNVNVGPATFAFSGALSNYSGSISLGATTGSYVINNATNKNPCTGSPLTSFDLGTGGSTLSNFNGGSLAYDLGSLAGGANTILAGRMSNSPVWPNGSTYRIGANGNSTTFSGRIADGLDSVGIVKVGTGTLLLNGTSTFSGGATISNGVLGGTGSIASALTVAPGGTLSPGAPMGTFTVSNNATLNGAVLIQLNNGNTPNSGELFVTGTLTGGGVLTVTNIGPDIPNGTKFQLFNKAVTGFSSVTFPTNNPSNTSTYSWQDSTGTDGSITLTSGGTSSVNTNPPTMSISASGGNLKLSWPPDHQGWQLLSNSVGLTATNMWFSIPGSTSVTQENLTFDITKTNVFFRMLYPPGP